MKSSKYLIILLLSFSATLSSVSALASGKKKRPARAYSFITEGGKASQEECDGEKQLPRKMKRLKDYAKSAPYMGSELQDPEIKGKENEEMWKHFFKDKSSCNTVLAKAPSAIKEAKPSGTKIELPPEELEEAEAPESEPEAE